MANRTLGTFIAFLRKEKGLTQKQLAEILNVSDKTVSHWECDETSPDISVLPILAETLGITVDELLKGEKKTVQPTVEHHYIPPKSESFATRTINKIKSKMAGDISERYRYFRMLSLAGTIIPCAVIMIITITNLIAGNYFLDEMAFIPGLVSLAGSLWILAISVGLTLVARLAFYKSIHPSAEATEEEKKYIYKSNSVCFNNLYLVFCALPMALTGYQDILDFAVILNILIAVICLAVLWLMLILILNKKGFLCTKKKKILILKYASIFVASALIVSWALLSFGEIYTSDVEEIVFDNSAEFVAYMETAKNKPDDAYLIDGVQATTYPATIPAPGNEAEDDTSVSTEEISDEDTEVTLLGQYETEIVTFKWLNNEVYDCYYNEMDSTFRVITYEAKIKQKDNNILVDDGVPVAVVMFIVADAVTCLLLYKRKSNTLKEG